MKIISSPCFVLASLLISTSSFADDKTQSGYEDASGLAGPQSVKAELHENDIDRESIYAFNTLQTTFKPYFDWKRSINEDHGLSFGLSAYFLYQQAGDASIDDNNAAAGIYRFQGSWKALTLDDGSTGTLNWRVENRSSLGGKEAPATLGGSIAAAQNPGFGYSENFKTDLSVLNWTQGFANNTVGIAIGRLAFDAYLDAFAFQTFSRGFINRAFILNPTMGTTGIGALGVVSKGYVTENIWLGAHIYDANAASGEFDMDTVNEGEYLKAVEFGWTPSHSRKKTDRIQLSYWQKDARELAGTDSGDGFVLSASWQLENTLLPFVRYGNSDGGAGVVATQTLATGLELAVRPDQHFTVGLAWSELNDKNYVNNVDDEWVLETSYKFQTSKNFSITPDIQYLQNPANLTNEDNTWVASIRAILTL